MAKETVNIQAKTKESYYKQLAEPEGDVAIYIKEVRRFVPRYEEELIPKTLEALESVASDGISVDLGCGPGDFSAQIYKKLNPKKMYWVDESPEMVKSAKVIAENEKIIPEIMNTSIENFNPNEKFDAMHSSLAFHNIPQEKKKLGIKKVFSLLKSGGVFIWTDLIHFKNQEQQKAAVDYRKNYALEREADPQFVEDSFKKEAESDFPLTIEETEEMLAKIGFVDIKRIWESTTFLTVSAKKP